jgi:VWFA-related protein
VLHARDAASDVLRNALHRTDLAAVATYRAARGVELVLGFTADREQVQAAIDTLGLAEPLAPVVDPLAFMITEVGDSMREEGQNAARGPGGPGGGGGGPQALAATEFFLALQDLQALNERSSRDRQQNDILSMTGAFTELAQMLGAIEGRVHAVLLSEGFDTSVALGLRGDTAEEQGRIAEINDAAAVGELWRVDSEKRFGSGTALSGMDEAIDAFRRSGVTVQAVDVGGLRAGHDIGRSAGEDGLFYLADQTGGELYRNFNDLGDAMGRMLHRTSVSYLLSFQPEGLALDGSYHDLEVKLKGRRRGLRVLHRPGYYPRRSTVWLCHKTPRRSLTLTTPECGGNGQTHIRGGTSRHPPPPPRRRVDPAPYRLVPGRDAGLRFPRLDPRTG